MEHNTREGRKSVRLRGPGSLRKDVVFYTMQEICACEISKYDSLKILRQGRYQLACQYGWRRLCGVLSLDEELQRAERWKISFSQGLAPQMVIQCQVVSCKLAHL